MSGPGGGVLKLCVILLYAYVIERLWNLCEHGAPIRKVLCWVSVLLCMCVCSRYVCMVMSGDECPTDAPGVAVIVGQLAPVLVVQVVS